MEPAGFVSADVMTTASGSVLLSGSKVTRGGPAISVIGGLATSAPGTNSCTKPTTRTVLPTAAAAGGALDVNTKTPSDVAELPSPAPGVWMKNPLLLRAVTTPLVATSSSSYGEALPLPWISLIASSIGTHDCTGDALLRGFGVLVPKSAALLPVSLQPRNARETDVVLLGAGAGALLSAQLALP
jgi:hypothetical protein